MKYRSHFFGLLLALLAVTVMTAAAEASDRKGKNRPQMAANPAYEQNCGSCHMAYPAVLLPTASWNKLLPDSGEHFGEKLPLTPAEMGQTRAYLASHAADSGMGGKMGRKIMDSLGAMTPEHITDVPYIIRKHRKVDPAVFKRASVGGMANCVACHPGAVRGNFEDDYVSIPQ